MKYSVIFLLEEAHEDFPHYVERIYELFFSRSDPFEILIIANGTGSFLKNIKTMFSNFNCVVKAFELSKKTSQAVCLKSILNECNGEIIVVLGSYQQITQDSFIQLLNSMDNETDIINPRRQNRLDPIFNQFQSLVFNALVRKITRTNIHDLSCTVRIFRRKVLGETELYGDMYRFLPILAVRKGFKSKEVKCENYQAKGKTGFYSIKEYTGRVIDIFSLYFSTRFSRKPLRFFSSIGLIFFLIGMVMICYIFAERYLKGYLIGNRPSLILAIFLMVIGIQSASVGLLGEIFAFTHGRQKKEYSIQKII